MYVRNSSYISLEIFPVQAPFAGHVSVMCMDDMVFRIDPARDGRLVERLVALWRESVARSHDFLTCEDVERLVPVVRAGIAGVARLAVVECDGRPAAFMGVEAGKIEMLFVAPPLFGCGLGRRLVGMAVGRWGADSVDVNEQNPAARAFYERMGFRVVGRSGSDAQGNDFPILHMRLAAGEGR